MVAAEPETIQIRPNPGPQERAFASPADIVIYGGQAGGGKTFWLVTEPTRHIGNGKFRAGIFRRTYPQIKGQGGIWDEARGIYPGLGGRMREGQELDATFPSGASIAFSHLQHEKTKYEYQGHQFAFIGFDELTHFSETQFFYLLSRNRTTCGIRPYIRCTCNPDAGSWVAEFIAWWIDQDSGFPIPERSGVLRYFVRETVGDENKIIWADTEEELIEQFPVYKKGEILSATFIPAALSDNPKLLEKDPGYQARLRAQPRIERERLELGNWKASEGALIPPEWIRTYSTRDDVYEVLIGGELVEIPRSACRRFATCDTAGTSKEKAAEQRGDPPSWSVCGVWDYFAPRDMLLLVYIWRAQVEWGQLKQRVPGVLQTWRVPKLYLENAHYGQPLRAEIKGHSVELIGPKIPGMDDTSRGAKLERAIASGLLSRLEDGLLCLPDEPQPWVDPYKRELTVWTGLPKETADQIDVSSYAAHVAKTRTGSWGGVVPAGGMNRR